ncbi:CHAT domain-containing protein [Pleurocapsa sp. CCALA 161]|uniref:CHAT domain-containing protein n=1 Tax=Pleurocapsa sp. CCALA 161 TaxID=2107688 RepID=UPI000D04D421|nr:CHAT domain-containing protein [Pleurocapsa sp. CCALA 161]PSB10593.1 CHAT domain-containing protein [Pleurocapsa sp. CCALA 161]
MLGKILKSISWLDRHWLYGLISGLIAVSIVFTQTYGLKSQAASSQLVSVAEPELVDLEQFSDLVSKLESKWENSYERYFDRDFAHQSSSVNQIAERLRAVQEKTKINPAVIWAMPADDFLELILVTPDAQFVVKKIPGANRERLTKRIDELGMAIGDRDSLKYYPPARLIYNWIFKPLEPYLEAENIDTLLLCTGPKLRSLPFAALHDGDKFIVEKYSLALIPAFTLTDTSYNAQSDRQVLAMGTSKFNNLPSLPGVAIELETIVPKLWSGRKITDQDFTVTNLQDVHQREGFDIIHIASHSEFNPGSPEDSFIQFSDRRLSLAQINELNLNLPLVDLLVLSACQTALGDEDAEYGFAGLAMQAGVKSALASLWSIDDMGTVVLMSDFYQQLKSTPSKSAALRQAQVNLLQRKIFVKNAQIQGLDFKVDLTDIISKDRTQDFSHPYYWAGFTLIGNPW